MVPWIMGWVSEQIRIEATSTVTLIQPFQGGFVTGSSRPVTLLTRHLSAAQPCYDPSKQCDRCDEYTAALRQA